MTTKTETNETSETTEAEAPKPKFHDCQCFSVWDESLEAFVSCGEQVPIKRSFVPGHDAKLKSVLLRTFRAGDGFTYVDGGLRVDADPMEIARSRGWEKFMTPAKPKKSKAKKADEPTEPEQDASEDEPKELDGFHPAKFKVGRWMKDGNVVAENADGTLDVTYTDAKGEVQRLTLPAEKVERG